MPLLSNVVSSAGGKNDPLILKYTTSTVGQIQQEAGERLLHTYGVYTAGNANLFLGRFAGNFTLNAAATSNIGIGENALLAVTTGNSNTVIGSNAGAGLTVASESVIIGASAGKTASNCAQTTLVGAFAGYTLTTNRPFNTAIGWYAGYDLGNASYCTYIGANSGRGAGSDNNTAVGVSAGANTGGGTILGASNVFFGYGAGRSTGANTDPVGSAFIGYQAGHVSGADYVVCIGYEAGAGLIGDGSIAIGYKTLDATTAGAASNVAVGYNSLGSLTTGTYNVTVGSYAGEGFTTGGSNVGIGYNTLGTGTAVDIAETVAIGYRCGQQLIGNGSVCVGAHALNSTTTGSARNTAIGYSSLTAIDVAADNTALGYNTGLTLVTGDGNTFLGYNVASSCHSDLNNAVAIGYGAGRKLYGDGSIAIGYGALDDTAVGAAANVAIGYSALSALTTTTNNVAIGYSALALAQQVGYSVAIGFESMKSLAATASSSNIAIGYSTLAAMTSGGNNTIVGSGAVNNTTASTGNSVLGSGSGNPLNANSNYNTFVGFSTVGTSSASALSNCVAIGAYAFDRGNGNGSVAIGYSALDHTQAGAARNSCLGYNALTALTTGTDNIAIGYEAAAVPTTGVGNIAIGYQTLYTNTDVACSYNVVIGYQAGKQLVQNGSIAIGYQALAATIINSSKNTAVGYKALTAITEGLDNVAVGYEAAIVPTTGARNVAIGERTLYTNTAVSITDTVTIGYSAGKQLVGDGTVAVGASAMFSTTSGAAENTAVGYRALYNLTSGTKNTALGYQSGMHISTPSNNTCVGHNAFYNQTTGADNTCVGYFAGYSTNAATTRHKNTFIGSLSGRQLGTVTLIESVGVGYAALAGATGASSCVAVGYSAGSGSTVSDIVCIGASAGSNLQSTGSIAIGAGALDGTCTGSCNIAIGKNCLTALQGGTFNILLGQEAGVALTTATHNIALGYQTLGSGTDVGIDDTVVIGHTAGTQLIGDGSIAIGSYALDATIAGAARNSCLGYNALTALTTGTDNVAIGYEAATVPTTGTSNIAIGYQTLYTNTGTAITGAVVIGYQAGKQLRGDYDIAIGYNALDATNNASALNNIAIGAFSLHSLTSGSTNHMVGYAAGRYITTGAYNTALGSQAMGSNSIAVAISNAVCIGYQAGYQLQGDGSIAIGYQALDATTAGADNNTAVGYTSLTAVTTGTDNTAIGDLAGDSITTGSKNTFLGADTDGSAVGRTGAIALGYKTTPAADYVCCIGANSGAGNAAGELNGIGCGTTTPTAYFSSYEKIAFNKEGGLMIKMTNKTGANTIKGYGVTPDEANNNAFIYIEVDAIDPIGFVYESGVADGQEAWIVIAGRCQQECVNTPTRGQWLRVTKAGDTGAAAGKVIAESAPGSTTDHFRETGHVTESPGAAGLVWSVIHFL